MVDRAILEVDRLACLVEVLVSCQEVDLSLVGRLVSFLVVGLSLVVHLVSYLEVLLILVGHLVSHLVVVLLVYLLVVLKLHSIFLIVHHFSEQPLAHHLQRHQLKYLGLSIKPSMNSSWCQEQSSKPFFFL